MADLAAMWAAFRTSYADKRFADALATLREFPAEVREDFQAVAYQADVLGKLGDPVGEIALLRALTDRHPDMASLWVSIANAQKTLGDVEEAIASLRHAISIAPDYGKPWWLLSDLKSFRFDESDVTTMEAMLAKPVSPNDLIPLHFALAKALEDGGQALEAFDHYAAGNALRATTIDTRGAVLTPKVDRAIATFTADFFAARAGQGAPDPAPIFIVGLQRSGSTLIEQILASHPMIEGTSELPLVPQINREIAFDDSLPTGDMFDRITALDADHLRGLGERYLERAATYRLIGRPYFIDKLPGNWTNIGLIRLILPNATIIDARRFPLATGFSNFKQNYGNGAQFSYDLATIGRYYRDYLRMMNHFERIDPSKIHRAVNEALIEDFEPQVRALLAHVGVPFDPACLTFHTNTRAVRTPSAEQVRRPINRDGVDQWRNVEARLGPLKRALGPALAAWNAAPGTYCDKEV